MPVTLKESHTEFINILYLFVRKVNEQLRTVLRNQILINKLQTVN
jgi:hypothetical protein